MLVGMSVPFHPKLAFDARRILAAAVGGREQTLETDYNIPEGGSIQRVEEDVMGQARDSLAMYHMEFLVEY